MQKLIIALFAICFIIGCSTQNPNPNNNGNNIQTYIQGPNVTDFDGNVYPSVINCNQTWTSKNLNVSRYRNGDAIPQVTDPAQWQMLTTGAWCYYNNDPTMGAIYGKLYNWYSVNDVRGLAPMGWHVSTATDWKKLVICINPIADTLCSNIVCDDHIAGGALKEIGTIHWLSPNTAATNISGFNGLPGGTLGDGNFSKLGQAGYWWTADLSMQNFFARFRSLYYNGATIIGDQEQKWEGLSVRLVKD